VSSRGPSCPGSQALELLLDKTRETSSNLEFLLQIQRSAHPRSGTGR
jgi:hypothetical protein